MAKKWLTFFGGPHICKMITFLTFFVFYFFFLWYFLDPVVRANFFKFDQKCRVCKLPKKKVEKYKTLKILLFYICDAPQKISTILPKTRFWFLLLNNSLCSIPLSGAKSYIKETPGNSCEINVKGWLALDIM